MQFKDDVESSISKTQRVPFHHTIMKWSNSKMPRRSSMTLLLVAGYAVIVTLTCSYYFVIKSDNKDYSEANYFLPHNVSTQTTADTAGIHHDYDSSSFSFPVATHIVTHGQPRTATTLLFNMVAASYFLHLLHYSPTQIPSIHLQFLKN